MLRRVAPIVFAFFVVTVGARAASGKDASVPTAKLKGDVQAPRFFLLTVGIEAFRDDFWPALKWAKDDAEAVRQAVGELPGWQVAGKTLVDGSATRVEILKELKALKETARPSDIVVIYVSTHGTLGERDDGELEKVIVLHDTQKDDLFKTGLRHRELLEMLDGVKARRKLLVLATCHGGVGKSRLAPRVERLVQGSKGELAPLADVSEGALVLAAAALGEAAREDDKLKGDVYTHFWLEGLRVHDRNGDGQVTALEAHDYAKERTYAFTGGRQRPTVEAQWIGDADVPLRGGVKRRGAPVLEAYQEDYAGFQLKVEGGAKGRLPLAFPLDADGRSRITLYGRGEGKAIASYEVNAKAGETVLLDDVLAPQPFAVEIAAGQEQWRAETYERITGQGHKNVMALRGIYHWHELYGGLQFKVPTETSKSIGPGLEASLASQSSGVVAGVTLQRTDWLGWRLPIGLGIDRETLELTFEDSQLVTMSVRSDATLWGVDVAVERDLPQGFAVGLDAGWRAGRHSFGEIGDLDATRSSVRLKVQYQFGGVGRRL